MARESVKARERKRARMVAHYEQRRKELKANGDWEALDKMPKNSCKDRMHNRCRLTGRPKGYMRFFGVNRVTFRKLASEGKIPGLTKSSW